MPLPLSHRHGSGERGVQGKRANEGLIIRIPYKRAAHSSQFDRWRKAFETAADRRDRRGRVVLEGKRGSTTSARSTKSWTACDAAMTATGSEALGILVLGRDSGATGTRCSPEAGSRERLVGRVVNLGRLLIAAELHHPDDTGWRLT